VVSATLFSSDVMDWQTPDDVLDVIRRMGPIELDPCTSADNPTGALAHFTPAEDGLAKPWTSDGLVYVNPPYGRAMRLWMRKLRDEHQSGRVDEAILLIPARTDTAAWAQYVALDAIAVAFWHGRIRFRRAPAGAPFPSAFVYYGFRPRAFRDAFREHASIMRFYQ
jgi:phage N-6-adenine-methyltransferase